MSATKTLSIFALMALAIYGLSKPVQAEKSAPGETMKLKVEYKKDQVFQFTLDSLINRGVRKEAKIEGAIKINSVSEKWADGEMTFTRIYAIKAKSGNGVSANKDKVEDFKVDVRLFPNGAIIADSDDLEKVEKKLEDFLEDISLKTHFQKLFFRLPKNGFSVNGTTKIPLDNVLYELKKSSIEGDILTITGKPVSKKKNETVKGEFELKFDITNNRIVSLKQKHFLKSVREGIVDSETINEIERTLKLTIKK